MSDGTNLDAIEVSPGGAKAYLALAHGAGADMNHRFMEALATALGRHRIATLRYQFPFTQAGRRRPDRPNVLLPAVRHAVHVAAERADSLPLFAGGKSMGGRMTSTAQSESPLDGVRGLVFFGFPLHPAGKDGIERAAHLDAIDAPMLFLQGTRDKLARLDLIEGVADGLGGTATLSIIDGADHGFDVLKRSGRTAEDVMEELAGTAARWMEERVGG